MLVTATVGVPLSVKQKCLLQRIRGSSSPDIFPNALDPITQIIDAAVPLLQAGAHPRHLVAVEHLGLDPLDAGDAADLVDAAAQQTQTKGFHDQDLDLVRLHVRLAGDGGEGHGAVVRGPAEDSLGQRGEGDFLVEEFFVRGQGGIRCDVGGQPVVGRQVAPVEGEKELAQPGVRRVGQAVEDGVQQQLAEVVDAVRDQRCNAQIVRPRLGVVRRQGREVDAG